jgi:hypothetical protein
VPSPSPSPSPPPESPPSPSPSPSPSAPPSPLPSFEPRFKETGASPQPTVQVSVVPQGTPGKSVGQLGWVGGNGWKVT